MSGKGRTYHVESSPCWYRSIFPLDWLDADARKADRDHGPESEDFFDERCDVWHVLFGQAFLPRIAFRIDLHDL